MKIQYLYLCLHNIYIQIVINTFIYIGTNMSVVPTFNDLYIISKIHEYVYFNTVSFLHWGLKRVNFSFSEIYHTTIRLTDH